MSKKSVPTKRHEEKIEMSSIARRIYAIFLAKRFLMLFSIDCLIIILFWIFYWLKMEWPFDIYSIEANYMTVLYATEEYIRNPMIVLLIIEGLCLFFSFNDISTIRRQLRPLNELAVRAERLSRLSYDEALSNLEHMIDDMTPDRLEAGIHTGDSDLQSIETALNSLLLRMRENQKQQARFVSDASHELRTPIAVIQGYVNMLDRWGKEDEAVLTESIEALKNESEHMKTLIEQLLFLARGDNGRNTMNRVEFDLNEIMRDVYEESVMIDNKHPYIFNETQGALMTGDIAMIKQSMRIFIQNASKYSKPGDTITLSVKNTGGHPAYSVQDEGIGMRAADISHIFERFYRADAARNSENGGAGLGLSIAKWIVDAHQGEISVLSREEIGTRFTVTF